METKPTPEEPQYPELDKMRAVLDKSQVLTAFVDWLDQNGMRICIRIEAGWGLAGAYDAIREGHEELFARFFEIDLKKAEKERLKILEAQRKLNERG